MKEKKRGRREEGTLTNWILVWMVIVGFWEWRKQWRSKRLHQHYAVDMVILSFINQERITEIFL
jgi:hypothetical protein